MEIPIVIVCCIVSFLLGITFLFLLLYILMLRDNKKKKTHTDESKPSKKLGTMNIILIIIGVSLLIFTVAMVVIFIRYNSVPDTLITYVFITLGGECGVLGWIKTTKEKSHINSDDKEAKG